MKWTNKAAAFRILSAVPAGATIHFALQRFVTREWPRSAAVLGELWSAAQQVAERYRAYGGTLGSGTTFVEIGAGRDLAVAIGLRLLGVERVICLDVDRLARMPLIVHALRALSELAGQDVPTVCDWADLLAWGIDYRAPCRLVDAGLPARSADCFYSIDTLEHIPEAQLRNLLAAARTVLRKSGLSIHLVDYSDHYARGDASISRVNFLRYSSAAWARYNSRLNFVSRLRHSQYVQLMTEAGMRMLAIDGVEGSPAPEDANQIAAEFRQFSPRDLFMTRAWLVAVVD